MKERDGRENGDTKDSEEGGLLDQRIERDFVIRGLPGSLGALPCGSSLSLHTFLFS